ncbi:MAG TPA: alginate export family protein [Terriglobia bacterium]|nr:alginate export family protein [Terriglobia bacterium]
MKSFQRTKAEMLSRGTLVLVVLVVLAVSRTAAQTRPTDADRRYPLPTYDEDWRFLSDPNRRAEPWDRVKYVPLADGVFASFGGESRETYERFGHENFGLSLPSPNGYLLQRYLLHADIHVGSRLRLWTELNSSFETGRVGGPRPVVDEDKLDLHQGFVEFEIVQRPRVTARVRGGRRRSTSGPDDCIHCAKVNSFFQSGEYSGRAGLLGASNSIRLEPTLTLAPRRNVSLSTGWGFYWRESEQDGLYGIPGNLIVPSNGVPGHYEGSRPIAEVAWTLNPHLSVHLSYIFVFNGQFEEQSVHATKTESYISPRITYRF